MDKNSTGIKKKIAMAAVLVGAVLSILTFLFIHEVKEELWKQSVQTIIESTQQGCNTLKVQLMDDYQSMGTVTLNLREFASGQRRRFLNVDGCPGSGRNWNSLWIIMHR